MAAAYHLHSLRHRFANTLDQATDGDIRLVSEMLDHASIETTRTYLEIGSRSRGQDDGAAGAGVRVLESVDYQRVRHPLIIDIIYAIPRTSRLFASDLFYRRRG